MGSLNPSDAYLLDKVVDPGTPEFKMLLDELLSTVDDGANMDAGLKAKSDWKYVFPFRGEPSDEAAIRAMLPYQFHERGVYRNGVSSLAVTVADIIDLIEVVSSSKRLNTTIVVSSESETIKSTLASSGSISSMVFYTEDTDMLSRCLEVRPETMIFDHTTSCMPIDELLSAAYRLGVTVVDGVFPYNVAGLKGWDVVSGKCNWSYTHVRNKLTVGPDDDSTRMITYTKDEYCRFTNPQMWSGKARMYGYEIRKLDKGLATYRAVYLGGYDSNLPKENLSYSLPVCSDDDMVLITLNRDLAAGVFTSKSNNAQDLASLEKNYSIEVRRDLFISCVDFLIAKEKGSDIIGESIRYISQHNYVDLMDGIKIVRAHSLRYADALCVAVVCSLTAFSLRYRLTNESMPDIFRNATAAQLTNEAPLGALGRLAWYMWTAVSDNVYKTYERARSRVSELLNASDYIPGVCYDIYMSRSYMPDLDWFEPYNLALEDSTRHTKIDQPDAFTSFMGDNEKTSAPTVFATKERLISSASTMVGYTPNFDLDPVTTIQHFYDQALPGNSVTQIPNVAELKRVKDIDIVTEFYGKIEINKDVAAPERLHLDTAIRTAATPMSRTSLVDAIIAASKRNFNPPDLQDQNDPWAYARHLTDKFIDWAFLPNFKDTIGKAYKRDPITFNVADYLEWRASRSDSYRSALESECPEDLVELSLEKYDTIVKKRIKPKMSIANQSELSQPQVLVNMSKKDTALFSHVFRKIFERLDNALRSEIKSAGRLSDDEISQWLTENWTKMKGLAAMELDSSKYDKSQGLLARMMESLLMIELGLDPGVLDIFKDSYVGKVSSRALGLMFISAYQMKSGAPHTMLGNMIYNSITAMEAVGSANIAFMIFKGDDNVVWLYFTVDGGAVVSKMSSLFNLEVKLITGSVIYFSSGYIIPLEDVTLFVSDPLKIAELLGEPSPDDDTLREQFVSFGERVASLVRHHSLPLVLQAAVRSRLGVPELNVVAAIDALHAISTRYKLFEYIKTNKRST